MKLALPLLLAALALCCPDANAGEVCPALNDMISSFLMEPKRLYKHKLKEFDVPAATKEDALKVKACVDTLSLKERWTVNHFMKIVNYECNKPES